MHFIALKILCSQEKSDFLLAELSLLNFDSFEETDFGLLASCEESLWEPKKVAAVLDKYHITTYDIEKVKKVNWNEEWEKNYHPVVIDDKCILRASFHDARPDLDYEIVIDPKMSFGTGHHATTYQILAFQMNLEHRNKRVLDVGCGTGILSIMAFLRGARHIMAIDIDDWCIENSRENFGLNGCESIDLQPGGIEIIPSSSKWDLILANINKNVLSAQMSTYKALLAPGGKLIISGFYEHDRPDLSQKATTLDLDFTDASERNGWAMMVLENR